MLFNSQEFIFLFLPIVCCIVYFTQSSKQFVLSVFLVISLFFYGYYNVYNLPLIILSVLINYYLGLLVYKNKRILTLGVTLNLLTIVYFKYSNFILSNVSIFLNLNSPAEKLLLPLAISFFTFQQIAYLVDVYKTGAKEDNFTKYALFVTFFPHLIAGPITHHTNIIPQFRHLRINIHNLTIGLTIFIFGLLKKVFIADSLAPFANLAFNSSAEGLQLGLIEAWLGALTYTFQLYFDFSGYSDMAIGLGQIFGIILPINFNSPYKAQNIIDFWRRWHITLSAFLRDYLYIPLGGNKKGTARKYINLFITMLLGGLWHGANWTFVIWGALHGTYLIINHFYRWSTAMYSSTFNLNIVPKKILQSMYWLATQFFVILAWVIFRSSNITTAWLYLKSMFTLDYKITILPVSNDVYFFLSIALLVATLMPNTVNYMGNYLNNAKYSDNLSKNSLINISWRPSLANALLLSVFMTLLIIITYTSTHMEFLYFDF